MVVENVCGAQRWVGRARWHYGSFYLWGDVPALMPIRAARKLSGRSLNAGAGKWRPANGLGFEKSDPVEDDALKWRDCPGKRFDDRPKGNLAMHREGTKTVGHANIRDGHTHTRHLTNQRESEGVKFSQSNEAWFDCTPRDKMLDDKGPAAYSSSSLSRKAASAMIAKIPFALSQHIARAYKPALALTATKAGEPEKEGAQ